MSLSGIEFRQTPDVMAVENMSDIGLNNYKLNYFDLRNTHHVLISFLNFKILKFVLDK